MSATFAKSSVESIIKTYGSVETVERGFHGFDVWILTNGITIKLPEDNSRIPFGEIMVMCEVKLGLSYWELDYLVDNLRALEAALN